MPETNTDWYRIDNKEELDSPALVVYPDRVSQNIATALGMIGSPGRLRPHIKTSKSPDAARLMLEAGITKFKCATIAEAEMLGMCQAPDVLFAYQPVGPKLERFICVIRKYPLTKFSCLTDHPAAAAHIESVFAARGLCVDVYLDLNIGQNRTGIAPGPQARDLYQWACSRQGIRAVGLHAYDGHIRDQDFSARKLKCDQGFAAVQQLQQEIVKLGHKEPVIVAGGSPTYSIHCKRERIECSPGTFIYWDKGYSDLCPEQAFVPAALVVTRVISLPDATKICLDLGHKSIAAENELHRRVFFLGTQGLKPISQSEEHLVVETQPGHPYRPGDFLYGLPMHICPTVALYERATLVCNHLAAGEWKNTARDRKIGC